jgi:hypothetical protein
MAAERKVPVSLRSRSIGAGNCLTSGKIIAFASKGFLNLYFKD